MSVRNKRGTQTIRRARLAVTCVFVPAILLTPRAARASVEWTVCASGCNFTSITDAVTQSNPDDLIEVMPDLKLGPTPNPNITGDRAYNTSSLPPLRRRRQTRHIPMITNLPTPSHLAILLVVPLLLFGPRWLTQTGHALRRGANSPTQ